jgi:hypothetical protein
MSEWTLQKQVESLQTGMNLPRYGPKTRSSEHGGDEPSSYITGRNFFTS